MSANIKTELEKYLPAEYMSAAAEAAQVFSRYSAGKLYLIGGIARDIFLKNPVKDIDIAIEGNAIEFAKALEKAAGCQIIQLQENLRTAKVQFKNGAVIDFASTREEYYKEAGAMPIAHNFGCPLQDDVKRRDFTINTLAIALTGEKKFTLTDYFGGLEDIKNKKIKVLHDKSFIDDPSRIVRAVKFQIRLGFELEEKTQALMCQYLENPDNSIPLERIKNELKSYFGIKKEGLYKNILDKKIYRLFGAVSPPEFDLAAFKDIKHYFDGGRLPYIYFLMFLINSDFENERLNLTAEEKKILSAAKALLKSAPLNISSKMSIYKAFNAQDELIPVIYYIISKDRAVLEYFEKLQNIKLEITGNDLINAGFKPSCLFGRLFRELLNEKLEGNIKTKQQEIEFARSFFQKEEN